MKGKLMVVTILSTLALSSAHAKMSCKILMNKFEEEGKKTAYDLTGKEKDKYEKCKKDMKLLPNSFKNFESRTNAEAKKRGDKIRSKEEAKKHAAKQKKIRASREEYTFSGEELEEMFNMPVYAYRLKNKVGLRLKNDEVQHTLEKLTDLNELCKAIGKENDIKGMKGLTAKMESHKAKRERDNLDGTGVVIPDSFWSSFDIFETDKKDREKIRRDGYRKLQILEFSEVTCVRNDNKEDDFEDIDAKVSLLTKKKEFTGRVKHDEINIRESLEEGENRSRDRVEDDGVNDRSIDNEIDAILGLNFPEDEREEKVNVLR